MMVPTNLVFFVVPAIGVFFGAALFVITAIADKRALRRADQLERQAAHG